MKSLFTSMKRWDIGEAVFFLIVALGIISSATSFVLLALGGRDEPVVWLAWFAIGCGIVVFFWVATDFSLGAFLLAGMICIFGGILALFSLADARDEDSRVACVEAVAPEVKVEIASFRDQETARHYSALFESLRDKATHPGFPAASVNAFCEDVAGLQLDIKESARVEALG